MSCGCMPRQPGRVARGVAQFAPLLAVAIVALALGWQAGAAAAVLGVLGFSKGRAIGYATGWGDATGQSRQFRRHFARQVARRVVQR